MKYFMLCVDVLSAVRQEYSRMTDESEVNDVIYKRLVVVEAGLAGGCGDVIGEYAQNTHGINTLSDVVTIHSFCIGKQTGVFLGLQEYMELHVKNIAEYTVHILTHRGDESLQVSSIPVSVISQLHSDIVLTRGLLSVVLGLVHRKSAEDESEEREDALLELQIHVGEISNLLGVIRLLLEVVTEHSLSMRCVTFIEKKHPFRNNKPLSNVYTCLPSALISSTSITELLLVYAKGVCMYPPNETNITNLIMFPSTLHSWKIHSISNSTTSAFLLLIFFLLDCMHVTVEGEENILDNNSSRTLIPQRRLCDRLCFAVGFPPSLAKAVFPLWSLIAGVNLSNQSDMDPLCSTSFLKLCDVHLVECMVKLLIADDYWSVASRLSLAAIPLFPQHIEFLMLSKGVADVLGSSVYFVESWRSFIDDLLLTFPSTSSESSNIIRSSLATCVCEWSLIDGKLKELLESALDPVEVTAIENYLRCKVDAHSDMEHSPFVDLLLYYLLKSKNYSEALKVLYLLFICIY